MGSPAGSWRRWLSWAFVAGLALWGCTALPQLAVNPAIARTPPNLWQVSDPLPDAEDPEARWVALQPSPANPAAGCFAAGCHADLLRVGAYLHQPFAEAQCQVCHPLPQDHAAQPRPHEVTAQDIALCYNCHQEEQLGQTHPVGPEYRDPRRGTILTCTSTCHDPHGGPYRWSLRFPPGGGLCLQCHREEDL